MKNRNSVLYKYLSSYLLVMLIPLFTVGFYFYKSAVVNLREEVENTNFDKLTQVKSTYDDRIRELCYLEFAMAKNRIFLPYMARQGESAAINITDKLYEYRACNQFVDDIILYYEGSDKVYTSNGVSRIETLLSETYGLDEADTSICLKSLKTLTKPVFIPLIVNKTGDSRIPNRIIYVFPRSAVVGMQGTVIFVIKEEKLIRMTNNVLGDYSGAVLILDKGENVQISNIKGNDITPELLSEFKNRFTEFGTESQNINGVDYSYTKVKSEYTGWTFLLAMPSMQFFNRVINARNTAVGIILLLLLICAVISWFFSKTNYNQVRSLSDHIKKKWLTDGLLTINTQINEFDLVKNMINNIITSNNDLKLKLNMQRSMVREHVFAKVLSGEIADYDELRSVIDDAQLNFSSKLFYVMVISFGAVSAKSKDSILKILAQISFSDGIAYGIELLPSNYMAIIVNINETEETKRKQFLLAGKIEEMLKESYIFPVIGIGRVYNDLFDINKSFSEANSVIERGKLIKDRAILFYEDETVINNQEYWYPLDEQIYLVQSIKQADKKLAREIVNNILKGITEKRISRPMLKLICYDVINTVIKTINELNIEEYIDEVENILDFRSLNELNHTMTSLINKVCDYMNKNKEGEDTRLNDKILLYINKFYNDYNLNRDAIASEFGISASYLSRFFKGKNGCTITDYLSKIRIDEAKKLLAYSHEPLKDIVIQIGYVDVPNFIRKFKFVEGITPGQYREFSHEV